MQLIFTIHFHGVQSILGVADVTACAALLCCNSLLLQSSTDAVWRCWLLRAATKTSWSAIRHCNRPGSSLVHGHSTSLQFQPGQQKQQLPLLFHMRSARTAVRHQQHGQPAIRGMPDRFLCNFIEL